MESCSEASEEKGAIESPLTEKEKRYVESLPLTEEEKEAVRAYRNGDEETMTFKTPEEAIRYLKRDAHAVDVAPLRQVGLREGPDCAWPEIISVRQTVQSAASPAPSATPCPPARRTPNRAPRQSLR